MRSISIIRPDDWHVHLRDASYLKTTVEDISRYFGRAIVMPNLDPPVVTVDEAERYRDNIMSFVSVDSTFTPLMTLYLTDQPTHKIVREAKQSGFGHAMKLSPAGGSTASAAGVQAINDLYPIFEVMQTEQMVLAVHGEVADDSIDIFDREEVFIDRHMTDICATFPNLKIVFEHISTREAATFVKEASANVAATITAHHLLFNRNDLLAGGIKPIYYLSLIHI